MIFVCLYSLSTFLLNFTLLAIYGETLCLYLISGSTNVIDYIAVLGAASDQGCKQRCIPFFTLQYFKGYQKCSDTNSSSQLNSSPCVFTSKRLSASSSTCYSFACSNKCCDEDFFCVLLLLQSCLSVYVLFLLSPRLSIILFSSSVQSVFILILIPSFLSVTLLFFLSFCLSVYVLFLLLPCRSVFVLFSL